MRKLLTILIVVLSTKFSFNLSAECIEGNCVNGQGINPYDPKFSIDSYALDNAKSTSLLPEEQQQKLRGERGVPVFFSDIREESKNEKKVKTIYNACILDKSSDVDMKVPTIRRAVEETCEEISEDPSFLESWKYE